MSIDKNLLNVQSQLLRKELGEDPYSPIDVFTVVNQIPDLTIVHYPLGNRISGICIKREGIKLIAINSSMSYGRQRFSMSHELYHLYFDALSSLSISNIQISDNTNCAEKAADQFASYFLIPQLSLTERIQKISKQSTLSLNDVIDLEQYFGVSRKAMLWRLIDEQYLSLESANDMGKDVIKTATARGYDKSLYLPTPPERQQRTFGHYIKQVEELMSKGKISNGKYDELLLEAFRDDIVFGDEEVGGEFVD